VTALAVSPDGRHVVTGAADGAVRVFVVEGAVPTPSPAGRSASSP
jgi:hypothetical protein